MFLIFDCNNLLHRAAHTTGSLKFAGAATGAVFGFLNQVLKVQRRFSTDKMIFCFDKGHPIRKVALPEYKATRTVPTDPEVVAARDELFRQIDLTMFKYLPEIGFSNVFSQYGYEADDVIASVVYNTLPRNGDACAILISSDKDLYQLLSDRVSILAPGKDELYTRVRFVQDWQLRPHQWATVKSLAGCVSDNVPGIKGVGEVTAAKWLRKELRSGKVYNKLAEQEEAVLRRNVPLVRLPHDGCSVFKLRPDTVTEEKWRAFCDRLGFDSLRGRCPLLSGNEAPAEIC